MMNMGRAAQGGRNWEGFGADPFLVGEAAYETILGMQQAGVQACAKHYINKCVRVVFFQIFLVKGICADLLFGYVTMISVSKNMRDQCRARTWTIGRSTRFMRIRF